MATCKRIAWATAAALAVGSLTGTNAWAQNRASYIAGFNPFYRVGPGLSLAQAAYNVSVMGSAYSNFPPYAMGYAPSYAMGHSPYYAGGPLVPPVYVNPLAALGPGGSASFITHPWMNNNPYMGAALTSTGALPTNPGYDAGPYGAYMNSSSTGGYGGYPGYYPDPYSGYLSGAANVIRAQGAFIESREKGRLLNEQVRRERMENDRREFDNWLYRREHTPTAEDERERQQRLAYRRSINDPPLNEILSGASLNTLLDHLERQGDRANAPAINLDPDLLGKINVTKETNGTSVGLLRNNDGHLNWPLSLRGPEFEAVKEDRDNLNRWVPEAVANAKAGRVDPAQIRDMRRAVERIRDELAANLKDMPSNQHIEARRYLANLDDALSVLEKPDARNYFRGDWVARGGTVADLVKNMKERGLRFAPSVGGDEDAYLALQRALAGYSVATGQSSQVATEK